MTSSATLDRTTLSLSPLVVGIDRTASFFLAGDGFFRPDFQMRRTYFPDSFSIEGKVQQSAVPDIGSVPLAVYAQATTTAAVEALADEFEAACKQWAFTLTLTVDGTPTDWQVYGEIPQRGQYETGLVFAHMRRLSVSFPVNP